VYYGLILLPSHQEHIAPARFFTYQKVPRFDFRGCLMIELYHHGSSVCAAKVRFALGEKIWHGKATISTF
jgi:hypothetical protein